ncbi:AEC family transporter [Ornithinibacillus salinisoli]|uniref:AEC family transporter n=1 Tax=Ornithinibacillus salinisoli TaxID=1848459 RepID=A0ABW4VV66_9BACI
MYIYFDCYSCESILKYQKKKKHAMLLAGVFMNGGNYGLPVVLFAIGDDGFVYAMMIMVIMSVYMNTIGLYIAASGADENVSKKEAFIKTIKIPIIPAIVLGAMTRMLDIGLPVSIENTVSFLADAAIPLIMIVLGIQLSTIAFRSISFKSVSSLVFLRLFVSPLLAIGIIYLMGLNGTLLASVVIIIAAMPTAANTTMFSVKYNVEPDLVSSTTLISTLLSLITLPIWFQFI